MSDSVYVTLPEIQPAPGLHHIIPFNGMKYDIFERVSTKITTAKVDQFVPDSMGRYKLPRIGH